jgi:hypothetical protein
MQPSIPVSAFVNPKPGSRPWNAIQRAIDLQSTTKVELVGEIRGERWYRVRAKGRDRHAVIIWHSSLSQQEVMKCDCEAHYIPQEPTECFHLASVLIYEATQEAPKLASTGREGTGNGRE